MIRNIKEAEEVRDRILARATDRLDRAMAVNDELMLEVLTRIQNADPDSVTSFSEAELLVFVDMAKVGASCVMFEHGSRLIKKMESN